MAGAVLGSPSTTISGSNTTAVPATGISGLLGSVRTNEAQAIAAGLKLFQSSKLHLGRELSIDVVPETLIGANSAELQVTLKADDEAASGLYSSGGSGDAEISRFGKSDTSTRVRVDSLKMFEVSSFASQLMTPKKRIPILPLPLLEMPYFAVVLGGTPIGAPIVGWVANHFGPRWALGVGASSGFAAALVAAYVLKRESNDDGFANHEPSELTLSSFEAKERVP
jgi:hypothetical protein